MMLPASQFLAATPVQKALGLILGQERHVREQRATAVMRKHEVVYARQRAMHDAVLRGDMSRVRRYNANPEYRDISPITPAQLRQARIEELRRRRGRAPAGMDLPDRPAARRRYEREMR